MMLSSEISDLESFIDSYVAPSDKSSNSPANWSRTQSFEEGYSGCIQSAAFNENFPGVQHNIARTETWGQKSTASSWNASARPIQEVNDFRPRIQERTPQWQQQLQEQEEQRYQMQWGAPPPVHQEFNPSHAPQDPNQIQAIVTNLIMQNNMNKPPTNLPPWIDVSRPPPSLPSAMGGAPPINYNNPPDGYVYYESQNDPRLIGQEPILQSMTFQRSNPVPSNAQFMMSENVELPPMQSNIPQSENWGNRELPYGSTVQYTPQTLENQQYYSPTPPPQPQPVSDQQQMPDFHTAILQGGHYDSPDMNRQIPSEQQRPSSIGSSHVDQVKESIEKPTGSASKEVPEPAREASAKPQQPPVDVEYSTHNIKTANEKYPHSRLRSQHNSLEDETDKKVKGKPHNQPSSYQRQESGDVFENETDERWKTQPQNVQVQISNRKHSVHRKISAADEDHDWRRKDNEDDFQSKPNGWFKRRSSSENENKPGKSQNYSRKGSREARDSSSSFEASKDIQSSASPANQKNDPHKEKYAAADVAADHDGQRHVTQKSKTSVLSWLNDSQTHTGDSVAKKIRQLQVSDSEADLTKFIETTQIFATTEAKMREVAEILCNKALKDTKFARNASILCDRMAFMMVHGTKFRTVVLNVMQGHYKNREHLFTASFRNDRRWFGFVTFLVELFLNVRTVTSERLVVLINPVFNCLSQVLNGERVNQEHIECFGTLFCRVGPAMESEDQEKMNSLMSDIRDRCVVSKASFVKRILLRCVQLYSSKWKSTF